MIRRADDTSTIYLKCGCFLPDNFTIFRGKAMKFANEDSSSFVIQCKGSFGIPSFRLEAKGSHTINFPKTGKFQFTSAANTTLKCIIEVLEQETKKELPPFLLYGSLGNYAESILAKKKEYENLNQLRKNRVNVTFSPVHDKEEELEEVNHIRTQRELFKHYKSSVPFASIANSSAADQNILRVENELEAQQETGFVFESENHTVWIEDFDFAEHVITVYVGDTISFALSPSVPLHAEHIIYGDSDNELLKFESDILQVSDCSRFEFKVTTSGEINVSCKIYHEMHCIIDVKPNTRRLKPLSMDESGITAVALISETSMDSHTHSAHSISSESFYDSDDVLSEVEHIDEGEMEEDEDDEVDVHHMVSIGDHFHLDQFGEDTDYIGDLDLVDILDAASLEDFIISIDADSFRPDKVDCVSNAMVKFILDPNYPSCTISCDGEFYGVQLNKYQSTYRHQFQKSGVFEVYNETLNFICCRVEVRGDAAVMEDTSPCEQPTSATLHPSITESGNLYSIKYPTPQMLSEEEPTQFRLFGSFISTKPIHLVPSQVPCASEDNGEYATVPLGYDKGLTSMTELTVDEQECLQVLQDCLAYDGMENLSRAAKKRLKYKQRIKLKKSQQGQQQDIGDSQESAVTSNTMKSVINTRVPELIEADVSTTSNGKKKKQKSALNRTNNQTNHENPVSPVTGKGSPKFNPSNTSDEKVPIAPSLPASNPSLTLSSSLLSEIPSGSQNCDSSKASTRSPKSDKRQLYSPDRKSSSTSSSIVSSPLSNARYAFAVADWTEDIEIVSDSDESSALTSSSVLKTSIVVEKPAITENSIPIQVDGFEETKNEVTESTIFIENLNSMDQNMPPKVLQNNSSDAKDGSIACGNAYENANLTQSVVLEVNIASHSANEEDSFADSSSSDSGSLCLIGVEDDRWMLTDEDDSDNSDCDDADLCNNSVEPTAAELSARSNNNETDLSLLSTNSQTSAAAPADTSVALSKRGLLFSVLGLSNAHLKDSDILHSMVPAVSQENSFEENNNGTGNMDAISQDDEGGEEREYTESSMSDENSMVELCEETEAFLGLSEDDIAWQRRWNHQQEFMNIFIQRVEEMTRKAKLQMTDKLPSGKNVGVYIWEDLPTKSMIAIAERDMKHNKPPPGLSVKHTQDAPADAAVASEQSVPSVSSDTAPLTVEVPVDRPATPAVHPPMNVHQPIDNIGTSNIDTTENKILKSNKASKKEVVREVSSATKKKRKPSISIVCEPTVNEVGIAGPLPPLPFPTPQSLPNSAEKQKKKNKKNHPRDKRNAPLDRVPDNSSSLPSMIVSDTTDNNNKDTMSSTATTVSPHLSEERHTKSTLQSATRRPSWKKSLLPDQSTTNSVPSEMTPLIPIPSVQSKKVKIPSAPVVSRPICTTVTTTVTAPAATRMISSVSVTASPTISLVASKPSLASSTSNVDDNKNNAGHTNTVLSKNVRKRHEKKKKSSDAQK